MKFRRFSQAVLDLLLRSSSQGIVSRIRLPVLTRMYRALAHHGDPLVRYQLDGMTICLPMSHRLPFYRRDCPQYSSNIARIARLVLEKYPDMTLIDLGANVGDTVAIVRRLSHFPILCIEGDPNFFALLRMNTASLRDVRLKNAFVGDVSGDVAARLEGSGGTAHVVEHLDQDAQLHFETLTDILKGYPEFARSKLIKSDTDGFDCRILRSELELLSRARPVVFFEYDPFQFERYQDDGFQVFGALQSIGYRLALFYENTGDFLLSTEFGNRALLEDLHEFYSGRNGERYCDVCAFHQEDVDLGRDIRTAEIRFSKEFRRVTGDR